MTIMTKSVSSVFIVVALCSIVCACSSSSGSARQNCGPGTINDNGTCVVADTGSIPNPFDSGGDATPNESAADTALADVLDGADKDSAVSDVAPDTAPSSGDPCPSKAIDVNCSSTCGGTMSTCASAKCGTTAAPQIDSYSKLPFIFRTPDKPGVDPACATDCKPATTVAYGLLFTVQLPYIKNGYRVIVSSPWRIRHPGGVSPFCADLAPTIGCAYGDSYGEYLIETTDPNAPARNVTIEEIPAGATGCP